MKLSFENVLFNKLVNMFLKKGHKLKAKKIVKTVFRFLYKETGFTFSYLVFIFFVKLNLFVEVRTVRAKKRAHLVPFALRLNRRYFLITKLLTQAILLNKKKISRSKKVIEELLALYSTPEKALTYQLKDKILKAALDNRSNTHYRW